jgi:hypothetical protein
MLFLNGVNSNLFRIVISEFTMRQGKQQQTSFVVTTLVINTLMALNFNLGICLLGSITNYPDVVRKIVDIPVSKTITVGIVIGYPDWDYPANQLHSPRDPIDKIARWIGI